jgi:hypothetical protein
MVDAVATIDQLMYEYASAKEQVIEHDEHKRSFKILLLIDVCAHI